MFKKLKLIIITCILLVSAVKGEVCKINYRGTPEELHNSIVKVSEKTVALSEQINVHSPTDSINQTTSSSIFFVIDHSYSMPGNKPKDSANDVNGTRFTVTSELIDTIYKKNPNTEVGLSFFNGRLYMDPADEPDLMQQIDIIDIRQGAFLKLLKLNKKYNSKQMGREATGYEILKFFLSTELDTVDYYDFDEMMYKKYVYRDLVYVPTMPELSMGIYSGGTNITLGFKAAKDAFKNAIYEKDKHFTVFFSDGEATVPEHDEVVKMEYVKGVGVSTNFTVFFTPEDSALENLNTMTENIRKNNYSSSNPLSDLYTIETSHDALMKLLMNNVLGKILSQVNKSTPIELLINSTDKLANWNGTSFNFTKLLPLTGWETSFDYKITYQVKKDTLRRADNFDTISTDVNFTVKIEEGTLMPDTFDVLYWDRTLEFYYQDKKINAIDISMKEDIEVRFKSIKIDTFYNYQDINIKLSNVSGATNDNETLRLSDKGEYFSKTFSHITGNINQNDNILQHESTDSIVAFFQNPDLPLDTIRITIPFSGRTEYSVTDGTYFDNNADGHIDSIYINVQPDDGLEEIADNIIDRIKLPSYRNFKIEKKGYSSGGIFFIVEEDRNEIETHIVDMMDVLNIDSFSIDKGTFLKSSSFNFIDSISPVILKATLVDSIKDGATDIMTVNFSESIDAIETNSPFRLYRMPENSEYEISFEVESQFDDIAVLKVTPPNSGNEIIKNRDSININWSTDHPIKDILNPGNKQNSDKNKKVEIEVITIKDGIEIYSAAYFDNNSNGLIDIIEVGISGGFTSNNLDEVINLIKLPSFRKFTVNDYNYSSGIIKIYVSQDIDHTEINTATTNEDIIEIKDTIVLKDNLILFPTNIKIADKMAPVILSALYEDSISYIFEGSDSTIDKNKGMDKLIIQYSEAIKPMTTIEPFNLYRYKDDNNLDYEYKVELNELDKKNDMQESTFKLISINGSDNISEDDSINIHNGIFDLNDNEQDNSENIKCKIDVKKHITKTWLPDDVVLELKATPLIKDKPIIFEKDYEGLDGAGEYDNAMVIVVEASDISSGSLNERDILEGSFTIYDCVGNKIISDIEMKYEKDELRLVYVWQGYNKAKRIVAPGTYLIVAKVNRKYFYSENGVDLGKIDSDLLFKKIIGVKY